MKNIHATDIDIQKFTFDQSECEPYMIEHINTCKMCDESVKTYLALSNIIQTQADPILEYNLSKEILGQLPIQEEQENINRYLISTIMLPIIGFILLTLYSFKQTIIYLLDNTLLHQSFYFVCIITFITLVLGYDLYRSFTKKINMVNSKLI